MKITPREHLDWKLNIKVCLLNSMTHLRTLQFQGWRHKQEQHQQEHFCATQSAYSALLQYMGNSNQALSMRNNGILLTLQLLNISDIPALASVCSSCPNYNFLINFPVTVWNAFPEGPIILPFETFFDKDA